MSFVEKFLLVGKIIAAIGVGIFLIGLVGSMVSTATSETPQQLGEGISNMTNSVVGFFVAPLQEIAGAAAVLGGFGLILFILYVAWKEGWLG